MKLIAFILLLAISQITFSQNVGIGTNTPTRAKLEVHGVAGSGATSALFGGEGTGISLQRNWPTIGFNTYHDGVTRYMANGFSGSQYLDPNNGGMYFDLFSNGTSGSSVIGTRRLLNLFPNGNISVGNAPNYATFTVPRGTSPEGTAVFFGTQHNSHFNYSTAEHTYIRAGKANGNVFINDITGGKVLVGVHTGTTKFGINSGNPTYTLEVVQANNTGMILVNPGWGFRAWELRSDNYNTNPADPQTSLTLFYNGRANPIMGWFRPNDGGYSDNSDQRIKRDIQTLEPVLDKVMQLRPTRYKMKDVENCPYSIGLIAQEANTFFPEMISIHENSANNKGVPSQMGINYGSFSVVAIKAIQEQQTIIEKQENKIAQLKERLARLEQLMMSLK